MKGRDGRRGLAFAGVVVVLAVVGVYLTSAGPSGDDASGSAPGVTEPSKTRVPGRVPTAVPSQVATTPAAFDIYSYLPLSKAELGAAADLARRFTEAYGTFRYDEDPTAFAKRLSGFATVEFGADLTRTTTAPALVNHNRSDEVVSHGTAAVRSIRDMTANMVTLVVGSLRQITAKSGQKAQRDEFAVTVIKVGTDWRVYDLQPADAGQDGDTAP
ncbi:hypothetical protein [Microtetraspora sp. NBRC 16547]|uniref:hypothetical protein n=1 Tax=Microtetraspora sp. NBRC 16547 TaxID=3030993 RepID=UPI00249FD5F7|nr:hypothetical protein [Microtetraspora sp. NBRC 16547]GLW97681.1 hypothetical protein Misp02_17680 [Microtetraspora sp. NBRC 16547]